MILSIIVIYNVIVIGKIKVYILLLLYIFYKQISDQNYPLH